MCKNLESWDDVDILNGYLWIADYMISKNRVELRNNKLVYADGDYKNFQIYGIHNKFWTTYISVKEWNVTKRLHLNNLEKFDVLAHNMNTVKNFMMKFNDMKLGEYVNDYRRAEISRKQLIKEGV